jgi:hypothetical protein
MIRFRRNHPVPPAPARLVRLHTVGPGGKADLTFEGLLTGVVGEPAHYVLERPRVLDTAESAAPEPPRGTVYEVPVDRVWFREVLAEDAQL